jgi:hypothetical protein
MIVSHYKDGYIFTAPSKRTNKKYDVFDSKHRYITSFGALGMEQYHDKIGYYSDQDHKDKQRLKNFNSRFKRLIDKQDPTTAMYFSSRYLW